MRLIILTLLSLQSHASTSLHRPTASQEAGIQQEIDSGRDIYIQHVTRLDAELLQYEQAIGLRDSKGDRIADAPPFELVIDRLDAEQRKDCLLILDESARYRVKMSGHFNEAIRRTQIAYGISDPKHPLSGVIRSGFPRPDLEDSDLLPSFLGQRADLLPLYSEELKQRQYGATSYDGKVEIGIDAFTYPGKLAVTLYHESLHFKDLLAENRDLRNDPAGEVRIREKELPYLTSIFMLPKTEIDERQQTLSKYRIAAPRWASAMAGKAPRPSTNQPPGDIALDDAHGRSPHTRA